jgi:hypothetical protein
MNWPLSLLAPWSALVAAAVIPPLVLLYFLKLKRREQAVSSTLLWKRAVQDLQVNSPFQRLRNNLLLILQLLILILAILAIMEPIWKRAKSREKMMIVLVDHSGSMSTVEADGRTRLEVAKEQAKRMVDDMGPNDQMMVISFAERAQAVASFSDDKTLLKRQIDAIEPTDASTRLRDAMTLAEAYSTPIGEGIGVTADPVAAAHLILISDGRIADTPELTLRRGTMELVTVGQAANNVGIVNMDVRRNYERPEIINVVVRVRNLGPEPATRDLSLFIDGELKEVRSLGTLAANAPKVKDEPEAISSDMPPEGSEIVASFDVEHEAAGEIEARLTGGTDAFPADDHAFGTIDAPRPVSTLLVTHGNYFLKLALSSLPGQPPVILSPEEYEKATDADLLVDGRMKYDVVVFDAYSTDRVPPGNYIFFGGVPKLDDVKITGEVQNDLFVDWDDTHPILRHVVVELIHVARWSKLEMPKEAETLIEGTEAPVLSLLGRDRRQYLICAFSLFDAERSHLNTNWVMTEGFPAFMYNALQYLAGNVSAGGNRSFAPGTAVAVPAKPGAKTVAIRRPDKTRDEARVREDGMAYYANTSRTGFYVPENAAGSNATFAVNLFDEKESCIKPNEQLQIGSESVASAAASQRVNRPLWPYLILAALLVSFIEWIIYNKRIFV